MDTSDEDTDKALPDEQAIREQVRKSLENIIGSPAVGSAKSASDLERYQEILDEETEKYYTQIGLVKHVSRNGRIYWVRPHEKERIEGRSRRRGSRRPRDRGAHATNATTIAIWIGTAVFAAALLAYLFATELIG